MGSPFGKEAAEVTRRLNEKFDSVFARDTCGLHPHVCNVCDRFIRRKDISVITFDTLVTTTGLLKIENDDSVCAEFRNSYKINGIDG